MVILRLISLRKSPTRSRLLPNGKDLMLLSACQSAERRALASHVPPVAEGRSRLYRKTMHQTFWLHHHVKQSSLVSKGEENKPYLFNDSADDGRTHFSSFLSPELMFTCVSYTFNRKSDPRGSGGATCSKPAAGPALK